MGRSFGSPSGHSFAPGYEWMAVFRFGDGIVVAVVVVLVLLGVGFFLVAQWRAMQSARRQREAEKRARPTLTDRPQPVARPFPAGVAPAATLLPASVPEPGEAEDDTPALSRKFPRKAWEERLRRDISST